MKSPPLFIIDNVSQTREWLTHIFEEKGFQTESYNSAESFLYQADSQQIGSIILENRLPGIDGVSLQEKLNQQKSPLSLIFYTDSISSPAIVNAIKSGAVEVIFKPASEEILFAIVEKAMDLSREKEINIQIQSCLSTLTKKENIILEEILTGCTNQQIADHLSISVRTVEVHRANIMKKFDAQNAVILATKLAKIRY